MFIRKAEEKDIPRILELLGQVLQIHAEIRPDVFIPGTTKYTDSELKELLEQEDKPIFVAAGEDDVCMGYAFCQLKEQTCAHVAQIQKAAALWEIPGIVYSQRIIHILNETFPAVLNTCEIHHPVLFHYQFIVLFKACRYGFIALDMQCVKHVHACHLYSPLCCLRNTISTVISAGDTPEILAACPRDSGRILSSF